MHKVPWSTQETWEEVRWHRVDDRGGNKEEWCRDEEDGTEIGANWRHFKGHKRLLLVAVVLVNILFPIQLISYAQSYLVLVNILCPIQPYHTCMD